MKQAKIEIKEDNKTIQLTIKDKIDILLKKYDDKWTDLDIPNSLKKDIYNLIQRVQHPEQFCPNCDERMFFDSTEGVFNCEECGYKSQSIINVPTIINNQIIPPSTTTTTQPPAPTTNTPRGAVPPQIEKAIAEADKSMKEAAGPINAPGALGAKIRKLVDGRDSGKPTIIDENQVKGSDPNVSGKINWC